MLLVKEIVSPQPKKSSARIPILENISLSTLVSFKVYFSASRQQILAFQNTSILNVITMCGKHFFC